MIDKYEVEHKMRIVSAPFCSTQYFNIARHLSGDTIEEAERLTEPRGNNVQFLQCKSPTSPKDLSSLRILSVQALLNIAPGEGLLVHY